MRSKPGINVPSLIKGMKNCIHLSEIHQIECFTALTKVRTPLTYSVSPQTRSGIPSLKATLRIIPDRVLQNYKHDTEHAHCVLFYLQAECGAV